MILLSDFRRSTAKFIHPRPIGRSRGRTYFRRTLSGQIGVTSDAERNRQSFASWAANFATHDLSRFMISSGTPTILSLFGVLGGS
jgi:hypothetical protein